MAVAIPTALMMIRPATFGFNPETAESNAFQQKSDIGDIHEKAVQEFNEMVETLRSHDIEVHVFDDTLSPVKPDAVFPNNWISFHPDGKVILYPMMAATRSAERRMDIVHELMKKYQITEVIDLSYFEHERQYLEGTGSVMFDHQYKMMYASRSDRTHEAPLKKLSEITGYRYILFDAVDAEGNPIYHTNVLMTLGSDFALLCLDAIKKEDDQEIVLDSLARTGKKVIAISYSQMKAFAGNMFEVLDAQGQKYILMSDRAYQSLIPGQINVLSLNHEILAFKIPHIETAGGGSVRCMVAGICNPLLAL